MRILAYITCIAGQFICCSCCCAYAVEGVGFCYTQTNARPSVVYHVSPPQRSANWGAATVKEAFIQKLKRDGFDAVDASCSWYTSAFDAEVAFYKVLQTIRDKGRVDINTVLFDP